MTRFRILPSIQPSEKSYFYALSLAFMAVAGGSLIIRTAADSLFLSTFGRESLAYMYLGTGVILSFVSVFFAEALRRFSSTRFSIFWASGLVAVVFALGAALQLPWPVVKVIGYFAADITISSLMLLFWNLFGQSFDPRQAKRLLGPIGAGGTIACIGAGILAGPFSRQFGTAPLFWVTGLLVLVFILMVRRVGRLTADPNRAVDVQPARPQKKKTTRGVAPSASTESLLPSSLRSFFGYWMHLAQTPQVRDLAFLVLTATAVVTLIDFQFKASAQSTFQGAELTNFFGNFYAVTNIVILLVQLFLVHRLFKKGGVLAGLLVLPAAITAGSLGILATASFGWIVGTRFVTQASQLTFDGSAIQLLYLGVPTKTQGQARAFIDGSTRPTAIALMGLLLIVAAERLPLYQMAWGALILAQLWVWLARLNHRRYVTSLMDRLGAHRFDPTFEPLPIVPENFLAVIRSSLPSASPEDVRYLLEIARETSGVNLAPEVGQLLSSPDPRVVTAVLQYLHETKGPVSRADIVQLAGHSDNEVRLAALKLFFDRSFRDVESIVDYLEDPDPSIRAETAAGLVSGGEIDALLKAVTVLKSLMESADPAERCAVAKVFSRIHLAGRGRLLQKLLEDPEPGVRIAALEAVRATKDPPPLATIMRLLHHPKTAAAALKTLVELGPVTLEYFKSHSDEEILDVATDSRRAAILRHIGGPGALDLLGLLIDRSGPAVSRDVLQAYCRLAHSHIQNGERERIDRSIREQLSAAAHQQRRLHGRIGLTSEELQQILRLDFALHVRNLLTLFEILTPDINTDLLYERLVGANRAQASTALEILDNVLPSNFKEETIELFEFDPGKDGEEDAEVAVRELLSGAESQWVLCGALYALVRTAGPGRRDVAENQLHHRIAIVRESAVFALTALETTGRLKALLEPLAQDPDDRVRRLVQSILAPETRKKGQRIMLTIEKLLFLRRVPLFDDLTADDLSLLATMSEEVVFPKSARIFEEGDYGESMFVVMDGEVLIHSANLELAVLGPKDYFGEMSILDGEPRSASATAKTDCHLLSIQREPFSDALRLHPEVGLEIIRTLVRRLREQDRLLAENKERPSDPLLPDKVNS